MGISKSKHSMSGVSLVEIMVALTIGIFLLGGLGQIYLSNKQSYETAEGLSRMQENLRFAAEAVAQDIRMAGFMPCRQTDKVANTLNNPDTWWTDFFNYGIGGYDGDHIDDDTGSDDHGSAGIPAGFSSHVASTDIVTILRGGESSYTVVDHVPTSAQFKINTLHDLDKGDIVMVCDLTNAAILQITNSNSTNVTIVHNTGTGSPGNRTKGLGYPVPDPVTTIGTAYTFGPDSHLVKFSPRAYFIGTNGSGGRSLYRARYTTDSSSITASITTDELVEGIENMQILYGVDANGDDYADRYVRADEVLDISGVTWMDVVTVRIGFLAQTPKEIALDDDSDTYSLAGTSVSPDVSDRKQRYQYNTTIKIRNRGAM
jgi:type IV pilus assembly protein PilW